MAKRGKMVDTSVPEQEEEWGPSRSEKRAARKGHQARLETVGERLTTLTPKALAKLTLTADVLDEVRLFASLGPGSAYARQRRRVASLLRHHDIDVLERRVEEAAGAIAQSSGSTDRLERMRRDLVEGGDDAIARVLEQYPDVDRQRLRAAVRAARDEAGEGPGGKRFRELFKVLKDLGLGDG